MGNSYTSTVCSAPEKISTLGNSRDPTQRTARLEIQRPPHLFGATVDPSHQAQGSLMNGGGVEGLCCTLLRMSFA
ncbi:hypothetical protein MTO96_030448 [Rhipicephalus appendiculatus]